MWQQLQEWDRDLLIYLNNLGVGEYDRFWIFITKITNWLPLYLLFFILFFIIYRKRKGAIGVGFTILVFIFTIGLTDVIKNVTKRLRPNNTPDLEGFIRVLQTPDSYSFFSGHAAVSFSVTTFIVLAFKHRLKWVYVFYTWPILFMMSRIFVGVHYPGDILVGTLVGMMIGIWSWRLMGRKFLKN